MFLQNSSFVHAQFKILEYNKFKYLGACTHKKEDVTMFCFRKKKNAHQIFIIIGAIIGALITIIGGYLLIKKIRKKRLAKKQALEESYDDAYDVIDEIVEA